MGGFSSRSSEVKHEQKVVLEQKHSEDVHLKSEKGEDDIVPKTEEKKQEEKMHEAENKTNLSNSSNNSPSEKEVVSELPVRRKSVSFGGVTYISPRKVSPTQEKNRSFLLTPKLEVSAIERPDLKTFLQASSSSPCTKKSSEEENEMAFQKPMAEKLTKAAVLQEVDDLELEDLD